MGPKKPQRDPRQLFLFEEEKVSVSWVAEHLKCGEQTVRRLLESGKIKGYRLTEKGWWQIIKSSVLDYQENLLQEYALEGSSRERNR